MINVTGWGMFWAFMIIYFAVDTYLFMRGYDTHFWHHTTDGEKQIQQIKIEAMKNGEL